jgi:Tol biopolymer transport system component
MSVAICAIALMLVALSPSAAVAAFPGENGRIAYSNADILTVLPDGSGLRQLTDDSAIDSGPSWSPDGRRLVFTSSPELLAPSRVVTINADGGDRRTVVAGRRCCGSASFSPTGRRILYTTGYSIRTIRSDGTDPRRVLSSRRLWGGQLISPKYSPSGRRIVFRLAVPFRSKGERPGIWSMRRNGTRLRLLTGGNRVRDPDYSPDGRMIVFGRPSRGPVWVMRADGSHERPIPDTDSALDPVYAPDGNRIAVEIVSDRDLGFVCSDIYTISPAGTDTQRVTHGCDPVSGLGGRATTPSWQPLP